MVDHFQRLVAQVKMLSNLVGRELGAGNDRRGAIDISPNYRQRSLQQPTFRYPRHVEIVQGEYQRHPWIQREISRILRQGVPQVVPLAAEASASGGQTAQLGPDAVLVPPLERFQRGSQVREFIVPVARSTQDQLNFFRLGVGHRLGDMEGVLLHPGIGVEQFVQTEEDA